MRRFSLMLLLALFAVAVHRVALSADLEVRDARLRLLPGDRPAAGYFQLENKGSAAVVLVAAESPAFASVMMHRSSHDDGTARMEHVHRLRVAPGSTLEFSPGGYHLMLMQPRRPLALGEEVAVTLVFENGHRMPVAFRAVSPTAR